MRRPQEASLDPAAFGAGEIGRQTATEDVPFDPDDPEALALVLHQLVLQVEEPWRSAVQMCLMSGIPYREAAELLTKELGYQPDPKTVWRWAQRGLEELAGWLNGTPWIGVLLAGRVPIERTDELVTGTVAAPPPDTDPNDESEGMT